MEYVGVVVVVALVATLVVGVARRATQDGPAEVGFRLAACELATVGRGGGCSASDAVAAGVDLSGFTVAQAAGSGLDVEGASFDELTAGLGLDASGLGVGELSLGFGVDLSGVSPGVLIDAGVVSGGVTVRDLAILGVDLGGADPGVLAGWGADVEVLGSVTEAAGLGLDLSSYTVGELRDLGIELDPDSDVLADVAGWTATDRFSEADLIAAGVDLSQVGVRDVLAAADGVFPGAAVTDLQAAGLDVASLVAPELLAIARSLFPGTNVITQPLVNGTRYIIIGDGAVVAGGAGDDEVLQLGGIGSYIDPGRGNNQVTILGGSSAAVVDSWGGNTVVRTRGVNGGSAVGAAGGGVDLSVIDEGYVAPSPVSWRDSDLRQEEEACRAAFGRGAPSVGWGTIGEQYDQQRSSCEASGWWGPAPEVIGPGEFVVVLGSDGTFSAALDAPGQRTFVVDQGVTVSLPGGVRSTSSDSEDNVVVGGTVAGGWLALGGGDDRVQALPGSQLLDVAIDTEDGVDTIDLGGALQGLRVNVGGGNDILVVQDTATGQVSVADPQGSWVQAGSSDVKENDTLALGPGFGLADPGTVGAGLVRVDETGAVVMSVALDGDPGNVEQIVVLNPDGSVSEQLQSIEPDVRRRGGFLRFLGLALSIAGVVTGLFPLTAAGVAVNSAYSVLNGADLFDVLVGAGTGLLGSGLNIGWLGPLGQAVVGATNGDVLGAVLQGAGAIGAAGGIPALSSLSRTGLGVQDVVEALDAGDALGALSSGIGVLDSATGTTAQAGFTQARAAVDLVNTVVGVANGSEATTLDALASLALSGVTLADTFGAFIPPPPPPPEPEEAREEIEQQFGESFAFGPDSLDLDGALTLIDTSGQAVATYDAAELTDAGARTKGVWDPLPFDPAPRPGFPRPDPNGRNRESMSFACTRVGVALCFGIGAVDTTNPRTPGDPKQRFVLVRLEGPSDLLGGGVHVEQTRSNFPVGAGPSLTVSEALGTAVGPIAEGDFTGDVLSWNPISGVNWTEPVVPIRGDFSAVAFPLGLPGSVGSRAAINTYAGEANNPYYTINYGTGLTVNPALLPPGPILLRRWDYKIPIYEPWTALQRLFRDVEELNQLAPGTEAFETATLAMLQQIENSPQLQQDLISYVQSEVDVSTAPPRIAPGFYRSEESLEFGAADPTSGYVAPVAVPFDYQEVRRDGTIEMVTAPFTPSDIGLDSPEEVQQALEQYTRQWTDRGEESAYEIAYGQVYRGNIVDNPDVVGTTVDGEPILQARLVLYDPQGRSWLPSEAPVRDWGREGQRLRENLLESVPDFEWGDIPPFLPIPRCAVPGACPAF